MFELRRRPSKNIMEALYVLKRIQTFPDKLSVRLFSYLDLLSQTLIIHRTVGEGRPNAFFFSTVAIHSYVFVMPTSYFETRYMQLPGYELIKSIKLCELVFDQTLVELPFLIARIYENFYDLSNQFEITSNYSLSV